MVHKGDGEHKPRNSTDSSTFSLLPGDFVKNWTAGLSLSNQSLDGTPRIKLVSLLGTIGGGIGLAWTYGIVGTLRQAAVSAGSTIQNVANQLATTLSLGFSIPEFWIEYSFRVAGMDVSGWTGFLYAIAAGLLTAAIVTWLTGGVIDG